MHNITITKGYEKTDIQFQNKFWINFFSHNPHNKPQKKSRLIFMCQESPGDLD